MNEKKPWNFQKTLWSCIILMDISNRYKKSFSDFLLSLIYFVNKNLIFLLFIIFSTLFINII